MSASSPSKLLVRGVNWLGDAVMSTPALLRLREAMPDAHITLLTRAKLADLWHSHPAIDEVLRIEPGESLWATGAKMRGRGFDCALVLPNSPRSALEVWLAGVPRRIGYTRPWRDWFLTDVLPTRPGYVKMRKRGVAEIRRLVRNAGSPPAPGVTRGDIVGQTDRSPSLPDRAMNGGSVPLAAHQMNEYLHLATALGALGTPLAPALAVDAAEVKSALSKFAVSRDGCWLGLNAGAEYGPAKRWPKDRFVSAVKAIQQRTDCGVLIFGGPGDSEVAADIADRVRNSKSDIRNVAGRTSLRELMALLTQCRVLLTNDTGPMHVAAALGVPVVVPFGSTSPGLTGPGLPGDPRHRLITSNAPCSPCFLRTCPIDFRCLNGIAVDQVANAVLEVWSGPNGCGSKQNTV